MQLTRIPVLAGIAGVTLAASYLVLRIIDTARGILPVVPGSVSAVLLLLASGVLLSAAVLRRRLRGDLDVRAPDPLAAARMVALAKATAHTGAVLAGVYAAIALFFLTGDSSDLRRDRAVSAVFATFACLAVAGSGLVLERVCRVQPPDDPPALMR